MELEVYFVDSFTSKVFGGNPAGVVFHKDEIEQDLMQNIAAENNLSETAFVHTSNNNRIRSVSYTHLTLPTSVTV